MGRIMKKKVPISAVGIFSYDGAEVGIFIAIVHAQHGLLLELHVLSVIHLSL